MNMIKKNGGFTLVELIVVIAILAILAGVAVPAYTGYIDKANKASDDAQIVVINQAIEAACALNGATSANATVTEDDKAVTAVVIFQGVTGKEKTITTDYNNFYAGNSVTAWKYYTGLEVSSGVVKGTK